MLERPPALFSPCRQYRYALWREWDSMFNRDFVMFIGLNPSTADEVKNDNTVTRCINFAKRWGAGAMCMTNLFAFRATMPADMKAQSEPIGTDNDLWLDRIAKEAKIIVAAWGFHGAYLGRAQTVLARLPQVHCLGKTQDGFPRHPSRLANDTALIPYP
jgi:hypothetical protein